MGKLEDNKKIKREAIISIARGLVGSLLIYPFFSNVSRCE